MCPTFLLPADTQMFSVVKCHQPARIAMERASGQHESVQSLERSLLFVALRDRAMELVNDHEFFLALSTRALFNP